VASYLRIGDEEVALVGGRLIWQRGSCAGRAGVVFHVAAHGGRRMLHLSGWAPGERVDDLTGQAVTLQATGPDGAVDGRFFASADVRFGRVRDDVAIVSIDGVVEDMDLTSNGRSTVEADVRCTVTQAAERRFCLGCGASVLPLATDRDEYVGGYRVRLRAVPVLCTSCAGSIDAPRHCPNCGSQYAPHDVSALSDEDVVGYTATCPNGHTFSGQISG